MENLRCFRENKSACGKRNYDKGTKESSDYSLELVPEGRVQNDDGKTELAAKILIKRTLREACGACREPASEFSFWELSRSQLVNHEQTGTNDRQIGKQNTRITANSFPKLRSVQTSEAQRRSSSCIT